MTRRTSEYPGAHPAKLVLLACSLAMLCLFGVAAWNENFGGRWRALQRQYRERLVQAAGSPEDRASAAAFPIEVRQIYLPDLGATDRCVTCHLGMQVPAMKGAPQPFGQHPGDVLVRHAPEEFGCTICHEGQGRAVTQADAHGWTAAGAPVPHAESRLLRDDAVVVSCGRCHSEVDLYGGQTDLYAGSFGSGPGLRRRPKIDKASLALDLEGAEILAEGKQLVIQSGCLGCHRYRGGGGDIGPDLTYVGDKIRHDFDFTFVKGEHTIEEWHVEHFLHPATVSPGSVMPAMGFTPEQARALALYMMSLRRKDVPASHMPPPVPVAPENSGPVTGETLFVMFCSACHGKTGRGDGPASKTIGDQPRDFWHERFRYVSTSEGGPTKEDLERTIRTGRGIEAMSSDPQLTPREVDLVADYIRSLSREGLEERLAKAFAEDKDVTKKEIEEIATDRTAPGQPLKVPPQAPDFRFDEARAKQLFHDNCASCHGEEGRGDGPKKLVDDLGRPIHARDLTTGVLRGGDRPEDIFQRIRLGIPGTPMPAQEALKDEEVWQLVHLVLRIAGKEPK